MWWRLRAAVALSLALIGWPDAAAQLPAAQPLPMTLRDRAAIAKARGLTSDVLTSFDVTDMPVNENPLRTYSVITVTLEGRSLSPVVTATDIWTIRPARIETVLARRTPRHTDACVHAAPEAAPAPTDGEIGLELFGGTKTIDGVSITVEADGGTRAMLPGARYLVIGSFCAQNRLMLPQASLDVFALDSHDNFVHESDQTYAFRREILGLRTVDGVKKALGPGLQVIG